jgi:hypothetical protein
MEHKQLSSIMQKFIMCNDKLLSESDDTLLKQWHTAHTHAHASERTHTGAIKDILDAAEQRMPITVPIGAV